ncbi:hypothetical protein [Sporosarcina psychrophila]|uniref:Uncharacterized protein n=1 Tax=Sporosarcina psychrophila TaxID=1476 RepID=A0ABV2KEW7_SPOPS
MRNQNNEIIQHIKETSDQFWGLKKKHGYYFLEKYDLAIKDTFVLLFSKMNTWDLKKAIRLPDNYFNSLMRAELAKRRAKAKLLSAHGRLCRKEGQLCLI